MAVKISRKIKKKAIEEVRNNFSGKVSEESLRKAESEAEKLKSKSVLQPIWDKIRVMFEIVKHPKLWGPKIVIPLGASLLYLVSPVDVILDSLPGIGFSDDIFIILTTLRSVMELMRETDGEKWRQFLLSVPEKLRPIVVSVLGLEDIDLSSCDENNRQENKNEKKDAELNVILDLYGGAGKLYSKVYRNCEKAEIKGKTRSLSYKGGKKLLGSLEFGVSSVIEKKLLKRIQYELDLAAEKSTVKDFAAFLCFALGIAFFRLSEFGKAMNVLSAIFLLISYLFFAISVVKGIILTVVFIKHGIGLRKEHPSYSLAECTICAAVKKTYGISTDAGRRAFDCSRKNKEFSRVLIGNVYRLFGYSIQRTIIKLVLISFGLYIMKVFAVRLHFNVSIGQMLLLPFSSLFS